MAIPYLLGSTRRRDPWDCSQDKLPAVDLETLMLEVEAYGRPIHQITTIRKAIGLPSADRALERKLKDLELWPADAAPFPYDISDALWMLPKKERTVAYGLLMGLSPKEIARQTGWTAGAVQNAKTGVWVRWTYELAPCFGLRPGFNAPDDRLCSETIKKALGYRGPSFAVEVARSVGVWHEGGRNWTSDGYILRRDFPKVWEAAPRWEDCLVWYITEEKVRVTDETYRLYFAQRYQQAAEVIE